MDLNELYSEHQISLMRAADACSETIRRKHLCDARATGSRIFDMLSSKHGSASNAWVPWAGQISHTTDLLSA